MRIGTGETVDAAQAVEALGLADRELLREGLAATLLHGAGPAAGVRPGLRPVLPARASARPRASPADREDLRDRLAAALAADDETLMAPAGGRGGGRLRRIRLLPRFGRLVVAPDPRPGPPADAVRPRPRQCPGAERRVRVHRPAAGGRDPATHRDLPAAGGRGGPAPDRRAARPGRDRPARGGHDRRPGRLPVSPASSSSPNCAGRFSRWPASSPPGSRHAGAAPPAAASTCAAPCADRCRRAGCR